LLFAVSFMTQPTVYVTITNHGFGHAARTAAVAGMIQHYLPEVRLIIATTAPRWLIASYITGDFIYRPTSYDVGVIQPDSLNMDLPTTIARWQDIIDRQEEIIRTEAQFLREQQVDLVLADVPPLAPLIAHRANVPCWAATNFGWDFIYRDYGPEFAEITDWISSCYQQCDRLFRLPLHESLNRFTVIEDVGLTGGKPRFTSAELRAQLGFEHPQSHTALLVFGGLGLQAIPYHNVSHFPDWQFLTFDKAAPALPNLRLIPDPSNSDVDRQYRPVDLFPLCGLVVSKPGYTTYAEAMIAQVPVATIPRTGFAESAIIMNGLQDHSHHQVIDADDFFTGSWDFLQQPLQPPRTGHGLAIDGTETIAQAVVQYLLS
jgi:hypothetical protein